METGFLSLKTYLFNLLTFVKRPGKEQAAHGVIPRKKNKYLCEYLASLLVIPRRGET